MAAYQLVVLSNAATDREAEYNEWYTGTHLPDVLKVPGINSARRLELSRTLGDAARTHNYLAIYDIETDDPDAVLAAIGERANTPAMRMSDAMAADYQATLYRVIAERTA